NHDGSEDLVIGNADNPPTVRVLLGTGTGSFGAPRDYTAGSVSGDLQDVVVGDFNGDGNADVAVTNIGTGTITVLPGAGDGTLLTAVTVAIGAGQNTLTAADLNGDFVTDIIAPGNSSTLTLLFDGTAAGARNVISGNGNDGVLIQNAGATGNLVA